MELTTHSSEPNRDSPGPLSPHLTPAEATSRSTFLALMWALSRPGRLYELPRGSAGNGLANFIAVGRALLDLETSYYTPDNSLAKGLALTGARTAVAESAAYHFYPTLRDYDLESVEQASVGEYLYPDRSATLVIGCDWKTAGSRTLHISGPGIDSGSREERIQVGGLPTSFWSLRERRLRYPLGFDVFLLSEHFMLGLPRTTHIEPEVA